MGYYGSDVGEDADISDGADLCDGGKDGLGFVTGSPVFAESSGKMSQTVSHSFSISAAILVSMERRSGECG